MEEVINIRSVVKAVLTRCKRSGKGRKQIAHEMSRVLGHDVTVTTLADFTRESQSPRRSRFPAAWVRAFSKVTGDDTLARVLLPEHLQTKLTAGEKVLEEVAKLDEARAAVAKLTTDVSRRQRKSKRS